tara:strand:+ start:523 stop:1161 length:639 start_codon:yes stop_codon:yes gene_type:complete
MAFKNTMIFNEPAIGSPAASWGSNLFVIHNAAHTADTKWNEPNTLVAAYTDGAGGQGTNSQEIVVPDAGLNLELFIAQDDASSAADCTVLCGVYGKVPVKDGVSGTDRKWPSDVSSSTFGDPTDGYLWVPLQNMEASWVAKNDAAENSEQCETVQLQTDATLAPIKYDVSGKVWFMYKRTSVYLSGCTSVCVSVQSADSLAANAMIVGRFVG